MLSHNFNIVFNYFVELVLVLLIIFSAPLRIIFSPWSYVTYVMPKNVIFFVEYVFHCVQNTALFKYATELSVGTPSHTHNTLLLAGGGRRWEEEEELRKSTRSGATLFLFIDTPVKVRIYKAWLYIIMQPWLLHVQPSTTTMMQLAAATMHNSPLPPKSKWQVWPSTS